MDSLRKNTIRQVWDFYTAAQTAKGVSDITLRNYKQQLHSISKYLAIDTPMADLSKNDLDLMVVEMRKTGLAYNTVATYVRRMRAFLNWCNREGYTSLTMANIKEQDTVKETYTDEELRLLLKKPSKDCDFCEYRSWVIVNFLLNSGCRAATVRNIQNRDVDLMAKEVVFRHTKGKDHSERKAMRQKSTDFLTKSVLFVAAGDRSVEFIKRELPVLFGVAFCYSR